MKINCIKKTTMFLAVLTLGCAVVFAEPAPPPDSNSPVSKDKKPDAHKHAQQFMQELSEKLNLTDAQKAAIKPILANDANEIKAVRQDGSLSEEQKMAKIKEIRENGMEKINAILTPEQQKEFAEIKSEARHRMREFATDRLEMLTEKLNLTDAQTAAIKPILVTEANEIKAVRQDNSLSKEQKQSKISDIRKATNKKISTILTPEQQAEWAKLKEHAREMRHKRMHPEQQNPADSNF
jgi:Spy/CpxP family protein refolding chaperone